MKNGTFQSQANRDARYRELVKKHGKKNVRRYSMRNQQLHPEYVDDWEGEVQRGFGNTQYRTFFSVLYMVEVTH